MEIATQTQRDYNVCAETDDGRHVPKMGPPDSFFDEPGQYREGDIWVNIECAACGITTAARIMGADNLEWN